MHRRSLRLALAERVERCLAVADELRDANRPDSARRAAELLEDIAVFLATAIDRVEAGG